MSFHTSVLLKEIVEGLKIKENGLYIDATLGGGGHTKEILELGGEVLGIDADQEAIGYVEKNFKFQISNFKLTLARGNFRDIDKIAKMQGFGKVSGIVFDLGVSSHQLETPSRGFSFQTLGHLDMRMDQELGIKAKDFINALSKGELYELFNKLGEESRAFELSSRIVSARKVKLIETTMDLVDIIGNSKNSGIHKATKVFQALRIAVNDELNALKEALPKALGLLESKGRILVVSFHSLEDRIVKQTFLNFRNMHKGAIITEKPIIPTENEILENRRARSAKLRIYEKT